MHGYGLRSSPPPHGRCNNGLSDMFHETDYYDVEENITQFLNLVPIEKGVPRKDETIRANAIKRAGNDVKGKYTCASPHCPYHFHQNGFDHMIVRDYHQLH